MGPRAGLFRLFTQIWNSVSLNDDAEVTTLPMPPERRLSNITPLPRQAFLLLSLEGFSEEEVAFILGNDVAETRKLADAAGREMAAEIATDVLIIEDETFIAMDLESLVKNLGHNVIGVARTHSDAVALAKNKKPGLILADIQLADGSSGLDAVNELLRDLRGPGGVHHRLSRALPDRRAPRAGVPDLKTVPAGDGLRGRQPGAVLPAQFAQPGAEGGVNSRTVTLKPNWRAERRASFFVTVNRAQDCQAAVNTAIARLRDRLVDFRLRPGYANRAGALAPVMNGNAAGADIRLAGLSGRSRDIASMTLVGTPTLAEARALCEASSTV